mmetsp:Transcript_9208/g.26774  ORF Transcript_9208/g.26774 Transcript_9208/m.26774 type:complete len:215 (+) Transcript_9208:558-1202(+)
MVDGNPWRVEIVEAAEASRNLLHAKVRQLCQALGVPGNAELLHDPRTHHRVGHAVEHGEEGRGVRDDDGLDELRVEELGELAQLALIVHELGAAQDEAHGESTHVLNEDELDEAPRLASEPVADPVRNLTVGDASLKVPLLGLVGPLVRGHGEGHRQLNGTALVIAPRQHACRDRCAHFLLEIIHACEEGRVLLAPCNARLDGARGPSQVALRR